MVPPVPVVRVLGGLIKTEIQKIDSKNRELESKMEELKVETIKERNQQNEKFETDKQKLIAIAKQLEVDIDKLQKELEESEEQSAERLGRRYYSLTRFLTIVN